MREGPLPMPPLKTPVVAAHYAALPHPEVITQKSSVARRITSPLRQVDMKKFL